MFHQFTLLHSIDPSGPITFSQQDQPLLVKEIGEGNCSVASVFVWCVLTLFVRPFGGFSTRGFEDWIHHRPLFSLSVLWFYWGASVHVHQIILLGLAYARIIKSMLLRRKLIIIDHRRSSVKCFLLISVW